MGELRAWRNLAQPESSSGSLLVDFSPRVKKWISDELVMARDMGDDPSGFF